ncbi:unnamed protein product [Closterium sp. Naga37s-1]|nr:unnamed protein product [Closterium sp. Naga37s-1]
MSACYELPHHRTHGAGAREERKEEWREERREVREERREVREERREVREERREVREVGGVGYNGAGWEGPVEQQGSGAGAMVGDVGGGRRNRLVAGGSLACPTLLKGASLGAAPAGGGMDGVPGTEQSSDGREVSERRARRMHKSASEANVRVAGLRGGCALAGSMGMLTGAGSGKWVNGGSMGAMEAQLRAEQEELAYLRMEAERIERSGVIDIVNHDGGGGGGVGGGGGGGGGGGAFPKHLSWNYRGLDITPEGSSRAQAGADRDRGGGAESVLASWAQERRELEGQVGAVKAELKRKERALKAAGKGKAAAGREVDTVWGQVSAVEAQLHDVQGDKSALEKEIQGLRALLHVSRARDSGEPAGARGADTEMAGMLKMVGDFSRRLALADDAVRRAEAKNVQLSERLKASEAELRGTREALRTAQEERDALAAEMKQALDTWAWTGCGHPAPAPAPAAAAATPGRGGSSGSGGMGVGASSTSAWEGSAWVEHTGQGMARNGIPGGDDGRDGMQEWLQRVRDIAGASQWGRGGYSAGGAVSRPPRDPKARPVQFDALACSPSPPSLAAAPLL